MAKKRVVVTGLGLISPLGLNVSESWNNALKGISGVQKVTAFDLGDIPVSIAACVKNFDATQHMPAKDVKKSDVFIQYGIAAADEAFSDSGLQINESNEYRAGVAIGSGIGGLPMIESMNNTLRQSGARRISPFFVPGAIINMVSGQVSMKYGLKGPNIAVVSACTTGTHNIGYAARTIAYGDADVMLAGGAEMATCPMGLAGFAASRALSRRNDSPEQASRPWDKDRDGFVLGEGAAVLVLEEYEHAKARGAKIYAELAGFGMSSDAYHITSPDKEGRGFIKSMQNALNDAQLNPEAVDYVNAHATATQAGDLLESDAVKKTFGAHAYELCVSSTKSMTGHLLGAAGAAEAIFSIQSICENVIAPTINLDNPDEGCDLNYVPHEAQTRKVNVALSNSFGFGGTNGTLIFSKV